MPLKRIKRPLDNSKSRKGKTTSNYVKKVRQSKREVMRFWDIPEMLVRSQALRYKNPLEKGIYWYFFSLFIRTRDVKKYGKCISCGRPITVETCDAGHYAPAGSCGRDLLFDERNVNAECSHCNVWDDMHLVGYTRGLDERYGAGTAKELQMRRELYKRSGPIKDWKKEEYEEKITQIKEKLKLL